MHIIYSNLKNIFLFIFFFDGEGEDGYYGNGLNYGDATGGDGIGDGYFSGYSEEENSIFVWLTGDGCFCNYGNGFGNGEMNNYINTVFLFLEESNA